MQDGLVVKPDAFSDRLYKSGKNDQVPGTPQHHRETRQTKNKTPRIIVKSRNKIVRMLETADSVSGLNGKIRIQAV
jgi:hypothetical protein